MEIKSTAKCKRYMYINTEGVEQQIAAKFAKKIRFLTKLTKSIRIPLILHLSIQIEIAEKNPDTDIFDC